MAVGTYALTSLAKVKAFLGISGTTNDTLLETLVDRVTALAESYTNRKLKARDYSYDPDAAGYDADNAILDGNDRNRLSYVIFNKRIASGTYPSQYWVWRMYDGPDPHTNHLHISFTKRGDDRGGEFPLPIFDSRLRAKLRSAIQNLSERIKRLRAERARKRRRLESL